MLLRNKSGSASDDVYSPVPLRRGLGPRLLQVWNEPLLSLQFYSLAILLGSGAKWRLRAAKGYIHEAISVRSALAGRRRLLADEGLLHHIFSLAFGSSISSRAQDMIVAILRRYYGPLNHVMVHLDVEAETCIRRFAGRDAPESSFNRLTSLEMVDRLRRDRNYQILLACYERALGRSVFTLRTDDDLERLVDLVLHADGHLCA